MKKLRQYYLGYISLLFLLFSTIGWGQIDITADDYYYKTSNQINSTDYLSGEFIFSNILELGSGVTSLQGLAIGKDLKPGSRNRDQVKLSTKNVNVERNLAIAKVQTPFIKRDSDVEEIRYHLEVTEGFASLEKRFLLLNILRKEYLESTNKWSCDNRILCAFTNKYAFKVTPSYNSSDLYSMSTFNTIFNFTNFGLAFQATGFIQFDGNEVGFGGLNAIPRNEVYVGFYRKLSLDEVHDDTYYVNDLVDFTKTDEHGTTVTYKVLSINGTNNNEPGFNTLMNYYLDQGTASNTNKFKFKAPSQIKIEATVPAKNHIPSYKKEFTIIISGDLPCFYETFSTLTGPANTFEGNPGVRLLNDDLSNFPIVTGTVYKLSSAIKMGTTGINAQNNSSINQKGTIISKPLNVGKNIRVDLDVNGFENGTKIKVSLVKMNGNNPVVLTKRVGGSNVAFSEEKIVSVRNVEYTRFETINVEFSDVPLDTEVRVLISTDFGNNSKRLILQNVRINCITPAITTWKKQGNSVNGYWTNGAPDLSKDAIIEYANLGNQNIVARSLDVRTNSQVRVKAGNYWQIRDALRVKNDVGQTDINGVALNFNSELIFEDGAYLFLVPKETFENGQIVKTRTIVNGPVKFESKIVSYKYDTNMFSSPVKDQSISTVTTNRFNKYIYSSSASSLSSNWVFYTKPNFINGVGVGFQLNEGAFYDSRTQTNPTNVNFIFNGIPINQEFIVDLNDKDNSGATVNGGVLGGHYSLGNPFTMPMNIKRFLQSNSTKIQHIQLWNSDNHYDLAKNDYINVNPAANWSNCNLTACTNDLFFDRLDLGVGFNAKMQAANNDFKIQYLDSHRAYEIVKDELYVNDRVQTESTNEGRLLLSLSNNEIEMNTLVLGYVSGATNNYDTNYDIISSDEIYNFDISSNDRYYKIEGRQVPFDNLDVINLRIKLQESGNYKIAIKQLDGFFDNNESVYLKDNLSNVVINLKETEGFLFYSEAGDFTDRFQIVFRNNLSIDDLINSEKDLILYDYDTKSYVDSRVFITEYKIFDLNGKLYNHIKNLNMKNFKVSDDHLSKGMYLITFKTSEGKKINLKYLKK